MPATATLQPRKTIPTLRKTTQTPCKHLANTLQNRPSTAQAPQAAQSCGALAGLTAVEDKLFSL
ncbi:MAG: hypothetical protein PHF42_10195 [Pseudomonas sp.]|nr:hypothetical protein [Pseudomonas sp.]